MTLLAEKEFQFSSVRAKSPKDASSDTLYADHLENIRALRPNAQHVTVLLAMHNGAHCLPDQLCSLRAQTHTNWSLIASDDASDDNGPELVRCFARAQRNRRVTLVHGPNTGFAANFLNLIRRTRPDSPYVAFCDQDDVWLPGKLDTAIKALADLPEDVPALYCGRTWICSANLRKLRQSPLFRHKPGFSNAIVQNIGGGNTMVFNRAALRLIQHASQGLETVASHDWWVYQIVSGAGGRVIFDETPQVLYRQHDMNVIGAGDGIAALFNRLGMVLRGHFRRWNEANVTALSAARNVLTPDSRMVLDTFCEARGATVPNRIAVLWGSGIRHQTRLGNAGLWLAAVLNRI